MIQTIKYTTLAILLMLSFMRCAAGKDQTKEKLKEGLEISRESLYEDEKGYMHYTFFVKNNNAQMIKSAKLRLLVLGDKAGMHPNEARFENLAAGDSVALSVNLLADYDDKQGYHFSSEVEEITF